MILIRQLENKKLVLSNNLIQINYLHKFKNQMAHSLISKMIQTHHLEKNSLIYKNKNLI
jgi:hypothetical protein